MSLTRDIMSTTQLDTLSEAREYQLDILPSINFRLLAQALEEMRLDGLQSSSTQDVPGPSFHAHGPSRVHARDIKSVLISFLEWWKRIGGISRRKKKRKTVGQWHADDSQSKEIKEKVLTMPEASPNFNWCLHKNSNINPITPSWLLQTCDTYSRGTYPKLAILGAIHIASHHRPCIDWEILHTMNASIHTQIKLLVIAAKNFNSYWHISVRRAQHV